MRVVMILLCALATGAFAADKAQPDAVLRGALTGQDNQTWRLVPFDVPAGTTRITVDFDYTTRDARTTIDLGIVGPDGFRGQDGFRGWSGGLSGLRASNVWDVAGPRRAMLATAAFRRLRL
jgi:hypothetical protein